MRLIRKFNELSHESSFSLSEKLLKTNLKIFNLDFLSRNNRFSQSRAGLIREFERKMSYNCMDLNMALHFSKLYEDQLQKALSFQILKRAFDEKLEFLIMYFKLFIKVE